MVSEARTRKNGFFELEKATIIYYVKIKLPGKLDKEKTHKAPAYILDQIHIIDTDRHHIFEVSIKTGNYRKRRQSDYQKLFLLKNNRTGKKGRDLSIIL